MSITLGPVSESNPRKHSVPRTENRLSFSEYTLKIDFSFSNCVTV